MMNEMLNPEKISHYLRSQRNKAKREGDCSFTVTSPSSAALEKLFEQFRFSYIQENNRYYIFW